MSPTTRIVLFNFWEYLAFVANSLVFLLIGLEVNLPQIGANLAPIGIAVLAVMVSRVLVVYILAWIASLRGRTVPLAYRHVLFWGGLRGAISLALVLGLPLTLAHRDLLRVMAFGVVLFTLLAQGTTMQVLLRKLGLVKRTPTELEYERRHGRLMAVRAARDRLEQLHQDGLISGLTWEKLSSNLEGQIQSYLDAQRALLHEQPALQAEELESARREGLRAQRAMLAALQRSGVISEDVYQELVTDVDTALEGLPDTLEEEPPSEPASADLTPC
jgi:CPA1 family monovalent cation:H+ antiporter